MHFDEQSIEEQQLEEELLEEQVLEKQREKKRKEQAREEAIARQQMAREELGLNPLTGARKRYEEPKTPYTWNDFYHCLYVNGVMLLLAFSVLVLFSWLLVTLHGHYGILLYMCVIGYIGFWISIVWDCGSDTKYAGIAFIISVICFLMMLISKILAPS